MRPSSRSSCGSVGLPNVSTSRSRTHSSASPAAPPARAASRPGSRTTTTSAGPTASRRRRRRSSATTTWAARRCMIKQQTNATRLELGRGCSSGTPPVPPPRRARRLLRRRGGDDRPRRRQGRPPGHVPDPGRASGRRRSASAALRSATGSSFDVDRSKQRRGDTQAPRSAPRELPAFATGSTVVRQRRDNLLIV